MDNYEGFKKAGEFVLDNELKLLGELRLEGIETTLKLHSNSGSDLPPSKKYNQLDILGTLCDQKKVSLISCVSMGSSFSASPRPSETDHFSQAFFPHFACFGKEHINSDDQVICRVKFTVDDAPELFYEDDVIGRLFFPTAGKVQSQLKSLFEAEGFDRKVDFRRVPELFYFKGSSELIRVDTVFGTLSVKASITTQGNDGDKQKGIHFDYNISMDLRFTEKKNINETWEILQHFINFIEIIAGRSQSALDVKFISDSCCFDVYCCIPRRRQIKERKSRLSTLTDFPIQPTKKPDEFAQVWKVWIERHEEWRDARSRFSTSFDYQDFYTVDRLISAANMFDILPASACPKAVNVPHDLQEASSKARKMFKDLPVSPERDSILSALGRIGKPSLKRKVKHRVKLITDIVGDQFPDINLVVDQAVNCRNHYVHGTETKIDYTKNFGQVQFFTDTLEFIFAASDLIESGWDISAWMKEKIPIRFHPFGRYHIGYMKQLDALKKLLEG